MKPLYRNLALAGVLVLGILFGLMLGERGAGSSLWKDLQSWFGKEKPASLEPPDPALQATLPVPDRAAGLPPCPLNDLLKPGLTPVEQTSIIGQTLIDYWTTVHSLPNGTWEEICAQLAGNNRSKLALVPREHPALGKSAFSPSPDGPHIHLHVISSSGCVFQLIYDGPDGLPFTNDDQVRNFPPDIKL